MAIEVKIEAPCRLELPPDPPRIHIVCTMATTSSTLDAFSSTSGDSEEPEDDDSDDSDYEFEGDVVEHLPMIG
jgi:hypothetical protein